MGSRGAFWKLATTPGMEEEDEPNLERHEGQVSWRGKTATWEEI